MWEYMVLALVALDPLALNESGAGGWELVALYPGPEGTIQATFKREKKK